MGEKVIGWLGLQSCIALRWSWGDLFLLAYGTVCSFGGRHGDTRLFPFSKKKMHRIAADGKANRDTAMSFISVLRR